MRSYFLLSVAIFLFFKKKIKRISTAIRARELGLKEDLLLIEILILRLRKRPACAQKYTRLAG